MRILYVFTGGRRSRFLTVRAGNEAPEEFLYGATYLQSIGYDVDILELSDLSPDKTLPIYSELAFQIPVRAMRANCVKSAVSVF